MTRTLSTALTALALLAGALALTAVVTAEQRNAILPDDPAETLPAERRWPIPAFPDPDPEAPRLFDSPRSTVPGQPAWRTPPPSHTPAFLASHGHAVGLPGEQPCVACHTERQCADCHAGLVAPVALHPPGYLVLHGSDALRDAASCASCHTPTRFCQSCHLEARALPRADGRPRTLATIHPPGWSDPASPVNHATEARRDILQCASCHTGDSCASCHIDINPHGSGFLRRCGSMLDAGAPTCARCHTGSSPTPLPEVRSLCGR